MNSLVRTDQFDVGPFELKNIIAPFVFSVGHLRPTYLA